MLVSRVSSRRKDFPMLFCWSSSMFVVMHTIRSIWRYLSVKTHNVTSDKRRRTSVEQFVVHFVAWTRKLIAIKFYGRAIQLNTDWLDRRLAWRWMPLNGQLARKPIVFVDDTMFLRSPRHDDVPIHINIAPRIGLRLKSRSTKFLMRSLNSSQWIHNDDSQFACESIDWRRAEYEVQQKECPVIIQDDPAIISIKR